MSHLQFDNPLPILEGPFPIGDKQYFFKEMSGGAAAQFRSAQAACRRLSEDGKTVSLQGIGEMEPMLVSLCLYEANGDSKPKQHPVPIGEVKSWPTRLTKQLFEHARKANRLDEDMTEETIEEQIRQLQELLDKKRSDAAEKAAKN